MTFASTAMPAMTTMDSTNGGPIDHGDYPPWIFLRGLARESRHWGNFVPQFEATMPASRVIALEFPGNGLLNQQCSPMCVQDMVEHCRAQLRASHIHPPYRLLALSLGGMVAVAWSCSYPGEISAQVLINTSLRTFSPFYERLRPTNYAVLFQLAVFGATPEAWERTILRITSNHPDDAVLPHWLAWRRANPVSRTNALRQLVAAARFSAPKRPPATATLLLACAQDRLVSVACSKTLARRWQCDLRIHPGAGHDLPLDDGLWVADQVREWVLTGLAMPEFRNDSAQ